MSAVAAKVNATLDQARTAARAGAFQSADTRVSVSPLACAGGIRDDSKTGTNATKLFVRERLELLLDDPYVQCLWTIAVPMAVTVRPRVRAQQ